MMGSLIPTTAWAYYGFPTLPMGQVEEDIRNGQGSAD
jgi:hypothetical protein